MQKVETNLAPAAIGPYSQAVISGDLVFVSGAIPVDPATGELVAPVIETQTRQALENLLAVLSAAGCTPAQVVKTTVFLCDMAHFSAVNSLYQQVFTGSVLPARSAVQVAALPKGAMIEIEAIARRG